MESFLLYLLKSSGIIALFLLCYILFLRKETFFRANRIYLLAGLGCSLFLPFIVFTEIIWVKPLWISHEEVLDELIATASVENPVDWTSILVYVYGAGVLFFTFRFVIQLSSLNRLIGCGKKFKEAKFFRVETAQESSPFSFFRYLVYNPKSHTAQELYTILAHEKTHAQGLHSVDMLLMNLFTILQWCNPFIWIYGRLLDDNLEYLADSLTIEKNANKSDYQYLLLRTNISKSRYSVATPFFNSSIKKRIIMINKKKSNRKNSFKYVIILPLLLGFVFLFNVQTEAQVKSIDSVQDDNDKYGPVVYDKKQSGDFNSFYIQPNSSNKKLEIAKTPQSPVKIGDPDPIYIVDGQEMSKTQVELLNPASIASINVLKGESAVAIYGEKGKNGAILITLKGADSKTLKTDDDDGLKTNSSTLIIRDTINGSPRVTGKASGAQYDIGNENPLIIVDGKETSKSNFEKLKPDEIESVNVLKGQKAIDKYGDKAKDGAIEVLTKEN